MTDTTTASPGLFPTYTPSYSEFDIASPNANPLAAAGANAGTATGSVVGSAVASTSALASSATSFLAKLGSADLWQRAGMFLIGAVLIIAALFLMGNKSTIVNVAAGAVGV